MRNKVINLNDINNDYLFFEYYKENEHQSYNPKKSMLKFIKKAAEITLTEKQKMYFNEFFVNGKSVNQIAAETNRHKSTVSREIKRVKQKLRTYSQLYF
ncbi:MAG: helix-turn-helix domain-containing protein [Oscillospiraceae bacterium]|nr:helix-turn-helix domain-containing protein [Oscillospiraceae bacterium]